MPNNWIGKIDLTDRVGILDDNGSKLNDCLELNDAGGAVIPIDAINYPLLANKLGRGFTVVEAQILAAGSGDRYGVGCSLYGDKLAVGAYYEDTGGINAGMVYIYEYNAVTSLYEEVQKLTASDAESNDLFGFSCCLHADKLVVGAPQEDSAEYNAGKVYIYEYNAVSGLYEEEQQVVASDAGNTFFFGTGCSLYGDKLAVGSPAANGNEGLVYVYEPNTSTGIYEEVQRITATVVDPVGARFGHSCSIYQNKLVVGEIYSSVDAYRAGQAYIYELNTSTNLFEEVQQLAAGSVGEQYFFGVSCSLYGNSLAIGAYQDDAAADNAGAVYLYTYDSSKGLYVLLKQLTADDAVSNDNFGASCCLYEVFQ